MSRYRVGCVNKDDHFNPWERIKAIGGTNVDGSRWRLSQEDAIEGIEGGKWSFFVRAGSHEVEVIVRTSRHGHKYLTTAANDQEQDNLLSLPECP